MRRSDKRVAWLLVVLLILIGIADRANAAEWKFDPVLIYSHTSDITLGCPFACQKPDIGTIDYIGAGGTIMSPYRRFEIDVTHGRKSFNCRGLSCGPTLKGTQLNVRFYPSRRKR